MWRILEADHNETLTTIYYVCYVIYYAAIRFNCAVKVILRIEFTLVELSFKIVRAHYSSSVQTNLYAKISQNVFEIAVIVKQHSIISICRHDPVQHNLKQ